MSAEVEVDDESKAPSGNAPGPSSGVGRVLSPQPPQVIVGVPLIDSRSAASAALVAFLECAEFVIFGKDAPNTSFKLNKVNREWPAAGQTLDVPIATVLDFDDVPQDAWSFVPAPLEETLDKFERGTVLWKTAEMVATCQVDFWLGNEAERQAVAARLPTLFAPSEDEWGIRVQTPPEYFGLPVRLSLMSSRRMDDAASIYPNERRLMCRIAAQLDEVQLRCAPRTRLVVDLRVKQPGTP